MKYALLFFSFIILYGCNSLNEKRPAIQSNTDKEVKRIICNQNYDSLLLKYANEFTATTIDLNSSLSSDLKSFLLKVDTNCLRKQSEYKYFITLILAKLALHHLKCCNQGYDLYQMREGSAAIIINEFDKMSGSVNEHLEMYESGFVMDYISSDKTLSTNSIIKKVLRQFKAEGARIDKGVF